MRLQIGLIFIFLTSFNYAQSNLEPSVDSTSKLAHYTLDMMRVVQGSIQFGREWNLGKNKSLKTCILFTWAQSKGLAKPYLNAQKFTYTDEQAVKYNLNETELLGGGLNLQWRNYYSRKSKAMFERTGAYSGPEVFFRFCKVNALGNKLTDLAAKPIDVNRSLFLGFAGYSVGYQKALFNNNLLLDLYLSGGFFISKYDDEPSFTVRRKAYQVDYTGPYLNAGIGLGFQF